MNKGNFFFFFKVKCKRGKNPPSGKLFILSDEINSPELPYVVAALLNSAILQNRFQIISSSNKKVIKFTYSSVYKTTA